MSGFSSKILLFGLLTGLCSQVFAARPAPKPVVRIPLYQGIQIGAEFGKPLSGLLNGENSYSIKADLNLKNTWFPTLELGHGEFDRTSQNSIHAVVSGNYCKIGLNKSLSYLGNKAENVFFAGLHYGFSSFNYSLDHLQWYPQYWGTPAASGMNNQEGRLGWLEIQLGVRVRVLGPFSLGWTGQYKSALHSSGSSISNPPFAPGFGENTNPMGGIALHVYYKLPF